MHVLFLLLYFNFIAVLPYDYFSQCMMVCREKDSLMSYIKSVSRALEEAKRTLIATQDSKLSENGNICDNIALAFSKIPENLDCDSIGIDSNIISPELIACQVCSDILPFHILVLILFRIMILLSVIIVGKQSFPSQKF